MEYNLKNNINEERSNGDETNLASQDAWDVVGDSNVTPVIKEDPLNGTNTEHVLLEAAVENTGDNSHTNIDVKHAANKGTNEIKDKLLTAVVEIASTNTGESLNSNTDVKNVECNSVGDAVSQSNITNMSEVDSDNQKLQNKNTNLTSSKIAKSSSGQPLNQKKSSSDDFNNVKNNNQREVVVPLAGSSNVGGEDAEQSQQLSGRARKRLNRLLGLGIDLHDAQRLCVRPYWVIRKFKKKHKKKLQNLLKPSFVVPVENTKSVPKDKIRSAPSESLLEKFRMSSKGRVRTDLKDVRNDFNDHRRTHSRDYERSDSTGQRMDFVDHASPSPSKYSVNYNRTHPRDYQGHDSTSQRTYFMDEASRSKYSYSKRGNLSRGPPTKYMRVTPSDHTRPDPKEIVSPRSSRQDFLENPEFSKVKIVNRRGPMTDDQMKNVHKALLSAIMSTGGGGAGPKFKALIPRAGWISISCTDQHSHNWLQMNVPMLRPWSGADLLVVSENERYASAYFPKSEIESIDCALRLLMVQNEGLQTDLWRVLNLTEDKEGFLIKFSMDESSADVIYRLRGKVTMGFSNIHFNFKEN